MNIWSKKLLMSNPSAKYTLTVTTDPVSATCTLTADGVSSSTKTLTVDAGTVISYSVYHATYGTTTGTITMNADKTLSCIGTYDETETEQAWTRPNLTSDGTLGVSDYAAYASSVYSTNDAYKAVDGSSSTSWRGTATPPYYWTFYAKNPIKATEMNLTAQASGQSGYYQAQEFQIRGSNDNSNWTTLHTKTGTTRPQTYTATLSPAAYYNYYQVYITKAAISTSTIYNEIQITATQKISSYTYYWQTTIT